MRASLPTKKLTVLALFTALSLAIYAAECALPPLLPLPGMKLGLANIITLLLLRHYTLKETSLVLLARILLSALLFGQAVSLLYSLAGGIFSLLFMYLVNRLTGSRFPFLTGAFGGLTHNMGQLLTAFLLTRTPGVFAYLPFLLLCGILTGLFTGFAAPFRRTPDCSAPPMIFISASAPPASAVPSCSKSDAFHWVLWMPAEPGQIPCSPYLHGE